MSRDFFKYLSERDRNQSLWKVMGSGRYISRTGYFESKASAAYTLSKEAIEKEKNILILQIKMERDLWNKIPIIGTAY
jgi:hypothetical protein